MKLTLVLLGIATSLMAQHHEPLAGPHGSSPSHDPVVRFPAPMKSRYPNSVPYNRRGSIPQLPLGYREFHHLTGPYFYHKGLWYRPYFGSYILCYPPAGLWVDTLVFPRSLLVGSVTYFIVEGVYYVRSGIGYQVVNPPIEGNCW